MSMKEVNDSSKTTSRNDEFVCVECFYKLKSLFKIYQDGFKDIIQCPKCNQLVDPYVECEYSVILIDLILLKKKTYNHIIINKDFKETLLIKFLVTFLLCDAYLMWFHFKKSQFDSIKTNDYQSFYALEWNFYFMLVKAIISFFIYSQTVLLSCLFNHALEGNRKNFKNIAYLVMKSIVLSSFAKLFVIPLVIWNPTNIYFFLAKFFTYLSNLKAITVATRMSEAKSISIVFISALLAHIYTAFLSSISFDKLIFF